MTKVINFDPTTEEKEAILKALRVEIRSNDAVINRKDISWSKRSLAVLQDYQKLDPCALLWQNLSQYYKDLWSTAGSFSGLTGWKLFFQDTSYCIVNGLTPVLIPNNYHQFKVGQVIVDNDEDDGVLRQYHPHTYKLKNRIPGQKKAYTYTTIQEEAVFPLTVSFNYKCNLTDYDVSVYLGVRLNFYGYKDGVGSSETVDVELDRITDWKTFSHVFNEDFDSIYSYSIDLRFDFLSGIFLFDNVIVEHSGENWAIDSNCDNIDEVLQEYQNNPLPNWRVIFTYVDISRDSIYISSD